MASQQQQDRPTRKSRLASAFGTICFDFISGECPHRRHCRFVHDEVARANHHAPPSETELATIIFCHTINYDTTPRTTSSLEVLYTASLECVELWVKAREREGVCEYVGFDTETRPCFQAGVKHDPPAVLQLATTCHAVVFQLNACRDDLSCCSTLAPSLFNLLFAVDASTSPSSKLVGMASTSDLIQLESVFGFVIMDDPLTTATKSEKKILVRNRHQHIVDLVPLRLGGLLELCQRLTCVEKWKSNRLQMTRWDLYPLSRESVVYAAMDAWAGASIYSYYLAHPPFPEPPPPPPPPELKGDVEPPPPKAKDSKPKKKAKNGAIARD